MTHVRRSSLAAAGLLASIAALPVAAASTASGAEPGAEPSATCSPTADNRPVCAADAPLETAAFLDPTVRVQDPASVALGHSVYVAPFAVLSSSRTARIEIGAESNVQDNVRVFGSVARRATVRAAMAAADLDPQSGVRLGERVILAHGSEVRGPARIGVDASEPDDGGPSVSSTSTVVAAATGAAGRPRVR